MTANPYNQLPPMTLFKVTDSVSTGTNEGRWVYTVRPAVVNEAIVDSGGNFTFEAGLVENGTYLGINVYEFGNTTTYHQGVVRANLPGTFALQPIPDDRIVPGMMIDPENPKVLLFWPNQFDGGCS